MEYIENNKLIAESPFCPDWVRSNIDHHTDSGNDMALNDYMENLKFHSEWRWIMPVVEKIEKLTFDFAGDKVLHCIFEIKLSYCCILGHTGIRQDFLFCQTEYGKTYNSKIEAVYDTIIKFIQWFNKQNKL